MKHDWKLYGAAGDWEMWKCVRCGRRSTPSILGFMWPLPKCDTVLAEKAVQMPEARVEAFASYLAAHHFGDEKPWKKEMTDMDKFEWRERARALLVVADSTGGM